jgi:hypothetical protein
MIISQYTIEQTVTADSTLDFGDIEHQNAEIYESVEDGNYRQKEIIIDPLKSSPLHNTLFGTSGNEQRVGDTYSTGVKGGLDEYTKDISPDDLPHIDNYRAERQGIDIEASMGIFIVCALVIIIGKFLYDRNQVNSKVAREGGMRQKYRELIDGLISGSDGRLKILKETSDSIVLGYGVTGSITNYALIQTFKELSIEWRFESVVFGNHKYDWVFPEYKDQNEIGERITSDVEKYISNISNSSPF